MTRRVYSREYQREAALLVTMRGVSVAQAAKDLGVHATVLRRWVREFGSIGSDAFPGKGQLTPDAKELRSLRREVAKLKAERDILKKGETIFRHWSEELPVMRHRFEHTGDGRTPTSPGIICDVWIHSEAQRGLAG